MTEKKKVKIQNNKYSVLKNNAHSFFVLYFERSNIHGFSYFGMQYLLLMEK